MKKKPKVVVKKRIVSKEKPSRMVEKVMDDYRNGVLKSATGKTVTTKKEALAIALNTAGLSGSVVKSFERIEIRNKIRVMKADIAKKIQKAEAEEQNIEYKITGMYMRPTPPTAAERAKIADETGLQPAEVQEKVNEILFEFLGGTKVDPKGFAMDQIQKGMKKEMEHTVNKVIATKIALDHLKENKNYYNWHGLMEDLMKKFETPEDYLESLGK